MSEVARDGAALGREPKAGGGGNVLLKLEPVGLGHVVVSDVASAAAFDAGVAQIAGKQVAQAISPAEVRRQGRRDSSVRRE